MRARRRSKESPDRSRGAAAELPDIVYVIQHSPDAGWNDVGIGYNPEQTHPYKQNDDRSEQSFHDRILPTLRSERLPKFRIGGLHQKKAPTGAGAVEGRSAPPQFWGTRVGPVC